MKVSKTMLNLDMLTLTMLLSGTILLTVAGYRLFSKRPAVLQPGRAPELQQLIGDLRHQLLQAENARRGSGQPALFKVGKCDIEVNVVVKNSSTSTAGFTYEIITAEQAIQYSQEQIQKVTLHLESVEQREVVVPPSDPDSIK